MVPYKSNKIYQEDRREGDVLIRALHPAGSNACVEGRDRRVLFLGGFGVARRVGVGFGGFLRRAFRHFCYFTLLL